jgi:hypothetical protein
MKRFDAPIKINTMPENADVVSIDKSALLRAKAVEIALSFQGQKEVPAGSNWGKFVQDCLKTVGITFPAAWCVAFTHRVYQDAAKALNTPNPHPKTAGVLKCMQMAGASRQIAKKDATDKNILAGYLGIMDFGKGLGHIYIVVSVEGNDIYTIEGNTDVAGGRTGGQVLMRKRSLKDAKLRCFITM